MKIQPRGRTPSEPHALVLPVSQSSLQSFIKGLLGRPQALIKWIRGSFTIGRTEIRQFHDLLEQRVEQNGGYLALFEARLGLSDDTIVTFDQMEDLLAYNAPRKVTSVSLDISWDYLIKFPDRESLEKQRVQLKVHSNNQSGSDPNEDEDIVYLGHNRIHMMLAAKLLSFRIEYTQRTWAEDVESMLSRYLHSKTSKPKGLSRQLMRHAGKVAFSTGMLLYASVIYGCFSATWRFAQGNVDRARAALDTASGIDLASIHGDLETLLMLHAEGAWASHILTVSVILVIAVPVAVLFATWVSSNSMRPEPSFITLTEEDTRMREQVLEKHKRRTLWYVFSILANVIAGIVANLIFRALF